MEEKYYCENCKDAEINEGEILCVDCERSAKYCPICGSSNSVSDLNVCHKCWQAYEYLMSSTDANDDSSFSFIIKNKDKYYFEYFENGKHDIGIMFNLLEFFKLDFESVIGIPIKSFLIESGIMKLYFEKFNLFKDVNNGFMRLKNNNLISFQDIKNIKNFNSELIISLNNHQIKIKKT
ncbi:MAG: hypothetical protein GY849_02615 [Deltaproteobacteria bacterium]|nr:hypothetical protein [Deltaproteobacteria bacterium]